jgi:UDPglucose 6-dehydrogenase
MNFFLATTITATNTLSVLAAKLGANWNEISHALKMDKRIGNYAYLTPGLGIGGSNIIRDLMEIKRLSYQHAIESSVIESILTNSNYMSNWISREFNKYLSTFENLELKIGLLGLTYKKDTHSIIRSSGLQFLKNFSKKFKFNVYDPIVTHVSNLPDSVTWHSNYNEVITESDVLIIATPWDEFLSDQFSQTIQESNIKVLIDPYRCVNSSTNIFKSIPHSIIGEVRVY